MAVTSQTQTKNVSQLYNVYNIHNTYNVCISGGKYAFYSKKFFPIVFSSHAGALK